jgi:hypothetical protein
VLVKSLPPEVLGTVGIAAVKGLDIAGESADEWVATGRSVHGASPGRGLVAGWQVWQIVDPSARDPPT